MLKARYILDHVLHNCVLIHFLYSEEKIWASVVQAMDPHQIMCSILVQRLATTGTVVINIPAKSLDI